MKFSELREKYEFAIIPQNKDITADKHYSEKNIQKHLNDVVLDFRRNGANYGYYNNIRVDDIQEVIHIVDLDGTFIPNSHIVRGGTSDFYYEATQITTLNVDGAIGRNRKKASIIRKLLSVEKVSNISFSIYYVSRDMDHVLFNKPNASREEKKNDETKFKIQCDESPEILNLSLFAKGIMAEGTYEDSWAYVEQNCNSLSRHSNINLYFGNMAKNPK